MDTKVCTKCKTAKPLEAFTKSRKHKNGLSSQCKECRAAYLRKQYAENPEKEKRRVMQRRTENQEKYDAYMTRYRRENAEAIGESCALYRATHKDQTKKNNALYYENNKKSERERNRKYFQEHPNKGREYSNKRRAMKKGAAIVDLSDQQIAEAAQAQRQRCANCGKRRKLTVDHITPIVSGGNHTLHNIVMLCRSCNSKKSTGPVLAPVQPLLLTVAPSKKKKP